MDGRFAISRLAGPAGLVLLAVLLAPRLLWGQATPPAAAPAAATAPATDAVQAQSPDDAAWAMLEAIRDYIRAARLREPDLRFKTLHEAGKRLMNLADPSPFQSQKDMQDVVTLWPSPLAHYVEGFDRRNLVVIPADQRAIATVKAVNPQDQQLADQLRQEITAELRKEGYEDEALANRLQVRLRRDLARRGVGLPLEATIRLTLVRAGDTWKVRDVALVPPVPRSAATRPATTRPAGTMPVIRQQILRRPATQPVR